MTDVDVIRIIVTGEHENLSQRCPQMLPEGKRLEWTCLPVLRFIRLSVTPEVIDRFVHKPVEWIIFTSQRSVHFWTQLLLDHGVDFPTETQVACIGEQTAHAASQDGYTPDFYPSEPGTEGFLEEFEPRLRAHGQRPSVLIPMAEGGRMTLRDRLRDLGCEVVTLPLYRTLPRDDLRRDLSVEDLERASLVLFTSPSSVDAFTRAFQIPAHVKIASLGRYTAKHLVQKGFTDQKMLPEGDFGRIGEVL